MIYFVKKPKKEKKPQVLAAAAHGCAEIQVALLAVPETASAEEPLVSFRPNFQIKSPKSSFN